MEAGLEEGEENRKGGGSMGARETRRGHEKTSKYVRVEKRYVRVGGEKTQLPAAGRDTNMASPVL